MLLIENKMLDELDFNLLRLKVNNESQKSVGVEGRYFVVKEELKVIGWSMANSTIMTVPFKEEVST